MVFDFRIIAAYDGTEIIDRSLKTPWSALTPSQLVEYKQWEDQLLFMDRIKARERLKKEYKRKIARNPLQRLVCTLTKKMAANSCKEG